MNLGDYIKNEITHHGPMNVATFMGLAVAHYYNGRDPFGAGGDFTTAPEISQMFGELLGAWTADCWVQMGRPASFALVECGPGRGTLMGDAMRATKNLAGFHDAVRIHLIETSESLRARQAEILADYDVQWHDGIEGVPDDLPLIVLGNEFLDALPVRQYQFRDGQWHERVIGMNGDGGLQWGLVPGAPEPVPDRPAEEGDFFETSAARRQFVEGVCAKIRKQGGAALFVDYGYAQGGGETLQALKDHKSVSVLDEIGHADITAHVDFAALAKVEGVTVYGPVTQGEFLFRLGIGQRAAMLKRNATPEQVADIENALARLTAPDQMGELFKAMAFSTEDIRPAGFGNVQKA